MTPTDCKCFLRGGIEAGLGTLFAGGYLLAIILAAVPQARGEVSHDTVRALLEDRSGSLWIETEIGLNRFEPAEPNGSIRRPRKERGSASRWRSGSSRSTLPSIEAPGSTS